MAVIAGLGSRITAGSTSGCDAELVAFMKDINLEKLAPSVCAKGYTRLADVLHLTSDMYVSTHTASSLMMMSCQSGAAGRPCISLRRPNVPSGRLLSQKNVHRITLVAANGYYGVLATLSEAVNR